MLKANDDTLEGKTVLVSGAGNVAQHAAEKALHLGGKVITFLTLKARYMTIKVLLKKN